MMKLPILKMQKYFFIAYAAFTFGLFLAVIIFSTSYYDTYLYGNLELVDFYTINLQDYNQLSFYFALTLVILFAVYYLFKPTKYYATFISFPIFIVILIIGIVFSILIVVNMQEITDYYKNYDYSTITKLENYQPNMFFPVFVKVCAIGLTVINVISLVLYSFSFVTYIKGRGEANV